MSRKKIRKNRKEITEEIDNGKREVGNRKWKKRNRGEQKNRET